MNTNTFNHLLQKIKTDKKALERIYSDFYPPMILHINKKYGKDFPASDVVHDVFLTLMTLENFPRVFSPLAWLLKMADNKIVDAHRSNPISLVELKETVAAHFNLDDLIEKTDLTNALKKLDSQTQEIILLHYWVGLKHDEIAEDLDVGAGNVRVKMSRAYKDLRVILKGEDIENPEDKNKKNKKRKKK